VPLAILGGLEGGLRLAGFGFDPHVFKKVRIGRQQFLVCNENFCLRFFSPQLARYPAPIMMEANKPADTCRIFIFGESAALGDPAAAYGAGRYLEVLLRERFPGTKFEVINLGMAAIDSHVIVPIARECAHDQGDFWIIYMGNNEMVGPFGAVTVFGRQAPPLRFVRLNLAIQETRVGQLMMDLTRRLHGKTSNKSWKGMEMFLGNQIGPDDPRKQIVYHNFQQNLNDIVHAGLDSGAKIILNTVAVNLEDSPPFASWSATNVSQADRDACNRLMTNGSLAESRGSFEEAAGCFEQASKLEPDDATLQYHWGKSLLHLANFTAARQHLQLACDDDALPFRADSRVNDLIRQIGRRAASPSLVLFDAANALGTNNPAGICGDDTFYEHVHFNFNGNYRLGLAWAEQIGPLLPATMTRRTDGDWISQETCEQRLGLTDYDRYRICAELARRFQEPPLSGQFNNPQRLEAFQSREKELRRQMTNTAAVVKAREVYLNTIKLAPDDYYPRENFGFFLTMTGDYDEAVAQWQQVTKLWPYYSVGYFEAGGLLGLQGRLPEAQTDLLQALELRPYSGECWWQLGNLYSAEQNFELALREYRHALQLDPQNDNYCASVGRALLQLDRPDDALRYYHRELQLYPDFWQVHFMLGSLLVHENSLPEAEHEYEAIIRLQPTNVLAHLDLGMTLGRQGQFDGAIREFEETLRLDPGNRPAKAYLEQTKEALNNNKP
jgi:tetratricopeptide (TPR) repeat protein